MNRSKLSTLLALTLGLAACGPKAPDAELAAAEKSINDARARVKDCAPETFAAAEALLAEAKASYGRKEYEASLAKANEADRLVKQAEAATPPGGCGKKTADDASKVDPKLNAGASDAASRSADLTSLEQTIYFDYNDASIREDGKAVLTKIAQMMIRDPGIKLEIEGHCDDRGSTEYNLHLGERRARAVEKYLLTQGVKGGQISTISYGEERPVDLGENDAAWAKNRRAELKKAP